MISFLLSFFLAYSQRSEIGCEPYFYTWCGLSAMLECRSEVCCTRLAGNAGRKNDAKNRHLRSAHHRKTLLGCIFATKACIDNRKISLNLLHKSHKMANFCPLTAEIGLPVWATPSKFQRISRVGFVTAVMSLNGSQPNFARCSKCLGSSRVLTHGKCLSRKKS